jgi:hypothetical protein
MTLGSNLFAGITLFLTGATLGALLGRRWVGGLADAVLSLIAVVAFGLCIVFLLRRFQQKATPQQNDQVQLPHNWGLTTPHLILASDDTRWMVRFQNLGRLESFQISVATPRVFCLPKGFDTFLSVREAEPLSLALFGLSLAVYAFTRLYALDQFPIYFFADEAIHPVLASDLARDGMRDAQGRLFPPYFQNGQYWNLSLSVYLHLLPTILFGKVIWVTRATSALVSLSGALAAGLIAKWFLKARWWWLVVLLLAVTPAWFLHSRTAFETVLMVSFYTWFLLSYLLYLFRSPNYLFAALVFGAATFYSYSNG